MILKMGRKSETGQSQLLASILLILLGSMIVVATNSTLNFTQPLNLLKLKIKKEIEVNLVPPFGILSITPKKVKVIYHEKGGK